jgi:hypothetical protein
MMLLLLCAALVGDLIMMPALLAGPLGKHFCPKPVPQPAERSSTSTGPSSEADSGFGTPHISGNAPRGERLVRKDRAHRR